jgi:hypothetical protein
MDLSKFSMQELNNYYAQLGDYEVNPIDIERFIEDGFYLGESFPDFNMNPGKGFYKYWMDELKIIYPSPFYSPYWLLSLGGSIGRNKTWTACVCAAYELYLLQCLYQPQLFYGLTPNTKLVFLIFNVLLTLAADVTWEVLSKLFLSSPYFRQQLGIADHIDKITRNRKRTTLFPKNIDINIGSRIQHSLGKAIMCVIFDEASFGVIDDQVTKAFRSAIGRIDSRFGKTEEGGYKGKVFLVSSESDDASEMAKILKKYADFPGIYYNSGPFWEIQREKYSKQIFKVFIGSDSRSPEIITKDNQYLLKSDPELILDVPKDFELEFKTDLEGCLKDKAGVPVASAFRLFRLKDKVLKSMTMTNLFQEDVSLDFDDETPNLLFENCLYPNYFKNIFYPDKPRHIHLDTGVTGDRFGLASGYPAEYLQHTLTGMEDEENQKVYEIIPKIFFDFAIGIKPISGKRIPFNRIVEFVFYLRDELKYPIISISTDGYEAEYMRQLFTQGGFDTSIISTDKIPDPYLQSRVAIYEGRVIMPKSKRLARELLELEILKSESRAVTYRPRIRIDHPKTSLTGKLGSKDISDCISSCIYKIQTDIDKFRNFELFEKYINAGNDEILTAEIEKEIYREEIEAGDNSILLDDKAPAVLKNFFNVRR